jgi:hypothetical protein
MNDLVNDFASMPTIPAMLLSIFAGAVIRAINQKGVKLRVAVTGFVTGIAFGLLPVGIISLFWEPDLKAWWPLWFVAAYFGNVIHSVVNAMGDRLAKSPWRAIKQVVEYLLEQALSKLKNTPKP